MKISRKLVMILLTTGTLATANAQIQFGVKAGPNFTTFTGSDASGAKLLVNFHGGAFVKIPFSDQFRLQPEVQYSGQGAKANDQSLGNITDHLNYLNVPVLLTFTHSSGLILQTGPQVSFLLSAKEMANGSSVDAKPYFKSTDFGWSTGIGYLSPANIGIIARYFAGWLNVENINATQGTGSLHNVGFQISVFYLFGSSDN